MVVEDFHIVNRLVTGYTRVLPKAKGREEISGRAALIAYLRTAWLCSAAELQQRIARPGSSCGAA